MSIKEYVNFDLRIEKTGDQYRARVLNSPAGEASATFAAPVSALELENFILRLGQSQRRVRRIDSPEMENAKRFGNQLFNAVFADDVGSCLQSSIHEAQRQNVGLRLRLRLADAQGLMDVPWEYLYDSDVNRFLALSVDTPLVRYLDLTGRITPLLVKPPLKVLAVISSPSDFVQLDVAQEWRKLEESVAHLAAQGLIKLDRLETATLAQLQHQLRRHEYHVFHFIGHGGFDEQAHDGVLLMEDEHGRGKAVSAQTLGMLLHDEKSLRLALLNACEGGRTAQSDPFSGVAQTLLQQGIPAVIAMQFEVSDDTAITMAQAFYAALSDGYPVDAALTEARKSIFLKNDLEWGTPVLYMRSPDGRIFDVDQAALAAVRQKNKGEADSPSAVPVAPLTTAQATVAEPHGVPSRSQREPMPPKGRSMGIWMGVALLLLGMLSAIGVYSMLGNLGSGIPVATTAKVDIKTEGGNNETAADNAATGAATETPAVAAASHTETSTSVPTDTETTDSPTPTPTSLKLVVPPVADCAGASNPPIQVGDLARICTSSGETVSVRMGPGNSYNKVVALDNESKFEVIGGPTCGDYNGQQFKWWQIRMNGLTGWIVDGKDHDPVFICRAENTEPQFGQAVFCTTVDSQEHCVNPVTALPSGTTKFWINWPFENLPINTQMERVWYRNDIEILRVPNKIWDENSVSMQGIGATFLREHLPSNFYITDGEYRVELLLNGLGRPIVSATLRVGGTQSNIPNFEGTWYTNFAQMTLRQSGNTVSGDYQWYGSNFTIPIEGTVDGQTLSGNYLQDGRGDFAFTMRSDGDSFDGYWVQHDANNQRRKWCGVRSGPLFDGCGFNGRWNTGLDGDTAWIELQQTGREVTGRYSNNAAIGTVTGSLGQAGQGDSPHYRLFGNYDIEMSDQAYTGFFRFDLLDFDSNQFQGCFQSQTTNSRGAWCGWRDGQRAPTLCEPSSCP